MTKLTQYVEAFWGPDFLSTAGYDALSKHNTEQKKFLQDFEEYLRKRAKMEQEYSKALGQLARSLRDRQVVGVLEASWNTLRGELETCRQAHDDTAAFFAQHADDTKRYCKDITAKRDLIEERLKKFQNQKSSQFRNVSSLSRTYRQKCREKDQAKDQYDILRREVTSTVKDLDRARTKKEKIEEEVLKADGAYKNSISALEDIRQDWEREMESACKEFQENDEDQIIFLRSEMWSAVNAVSQVALDVDESCERIRKTLETCDVNSDICSFITANSTGTERPAPVVYQNYYEAGSIGTGSIGTGSIGTGSIGGVSRGGSSSSLETQYQPRLPAVPPGMGSYGSSAFHTLSQNDFDPTYSMADPTYSMADKTYSMADPTYSVAEPIVDYYPSQLTICKSYHSGDNFTVQPGERVTFVRKVNANVVEVKTQFNRMGIVPVTCIREDI